MATRPTQTTSNRSGNYGNSNNRNDSVDVGATAIARMAREDTRWFIIAVVVLSVVLFLALPLSMMIYVDTLKMQAEIRYEVKQMKKLQAELKKNKEKEDE